MKTYVVICQLFFACGSVIAQPGANFYPHHRGDVWQFRSLFTGQVVNTYYIDSVSVNILTREHFIFLRIRSDEVFLRPERLDSLGNLYLINYQPAYPRYKLNADSGASWFAGYDPADSNRSYRISIIRVYRRTVFGVPTTVKVFRFEMRYVRSLGDTVTFSLGNDHLASEFGLVQVDVEPSDVYVLAGAIIDSIRYGTILNARDDKVIPSGYYLFQNYPNPFNPVTTIVYEVPRSSHMKLEVFDVLGQLTTTLVDQIQVAGTYKVQFDASRLSSGVYFYRLTAGEATITKRMLLLR